MMQHQATKHETLQHGTQRLASLSLRTEKRKYTGAIALLMAKNFGVQLSLQSSTTISGQQLVLHTAKSSLQATAEYSTPLTLRLERNSGLTVTVERATVLAAVSIQLGVFIPSSCQSLPTEKST